MEQLKPNLDQSQISQIQQNLDHSRAKNEESNSNSKLTENDKSKRSGQSSLNASSGIINFEEALPDGIHGAESPSPQRGIFGGGGGYMMPNSANTGSKLMQQCNAKDL